MRRIILLVTVAAVMAVMMALSIGPAFANGLEEPPICGPKFFPPQGFIEHGSAHACAPHGPPTLE
jgi:hypothetical protein